MDFITTLHYIESLVKLQSCNQDFHGYALKCAFQYYLMFFLMKEILIFTLAFSVTVLEC
jgi:hypothetical protein